VLDSDDTFFRDFFLYDNKMLFFRRKEDVNARTCVPFDCKEAILRAAHGDSVLVGHPGVDYTTATVTHFFYWPGLYANVAEFVRSCPTCAAPKGSNH